MTSGCHSPSASGRQYVFKGSELSDEQFGLFWICGALALAAKPPNAKYTPELDALDPQSTINVIVQWNKVSDDDEHAKVTRRCVSAQGISIWPQP